MFCIINFGQGFCGIVHRFLKAFSVFFSVSFANFSCRIGYPSTQKAMNPVQNVIKFRQIFKRPLSRNDKFSIALIFFLKYFLQTKELDKVNTKEEIMEAARQIQLTIPAERRDLLELQFSNNIYPLLFGSDEE